MPPTASSRIYQSRTKYLSKELQHESLHSQRKQSTRWTHVRCGMTLGKTTGKERARRGSTGWRALSFVPTLHQDHREDRYFEEEATAGQVLQNGNENGMDRDSYMAAVSCYRQHPRTADACARLPFTEAAYCMR